MKFYITVFLIFVFSVCQSQSKIKPGEYISSLIPEFKIRILNDSVFEYFSTGTYRTVLDTTKSSSPESNFSFKVIENKENNGKLKINYKHTFPYANSIYIGYQKNEFDKVTYKSFLDILNSDNNQTDFFEIDKPKYLYLVQINNNALVSKYEINSSTNEIELIFNLFNLININYDQNNDKLSINKSGTKLDFLLEKPENYVLKYELKTIESKEVENWKELNFPEKNTEVDATIQEITETTPKFDFKYTVRNNFQDALKSIEKTKKYLVVSFDLNNKNNKTDFEVFIKKTQKIVSESMNDLYKDNLDFFEFYNATEKDKNWSKKHLQTQPRILFFNKTGDLLYQLNGTLKDNEETFSPYTNITNELNKANNSVVFDKLMSNSKTTFDEFQNYLKELKEEFNTLIEKPSDTIYYKIETLKDLYKTKTKFNTFDLKWKQLVGYKKNKKFDYDFAKIALNEISDFGFSRIIYYERHQFSETDFEILDYLFANYSKLNEENNNYNLTSENSNKILIDYALNGYFNEVLYAKSINNANKIKLLDYFKNFLKLTNYYTNDVQTYINIVKVNDLDYSNLLDVFDQCFNYTTQQVPNSLIESLDKIYSSDEFKKREINISWENFKNNFASISNNSAWDVVEKKDIKYLSKAIIWSETSLKIAKNDYYYLDTLANLYYLNGEKQKAIQFEQQAIDAIPKDNLEDKKRFIETLTKMKDGK